MAHGNAQVDPEGRFLFDGLSEPTVNVFVAGNGENRDWTYRAAELVKLVPGVTTEVTIELIRGVAVEGTVVAEESGVPIEGATLGVYGPFRPKSNNTTVATKTDAKGRYRYRLPSGDTHFFVMDLPRGFTYLPSKGSTQTVIIPDEVLTFEVPPIGLRPLAK